MESITLSRRVVCLLRIYLSAVTTVLVASAFLFCKIFIIVFLSAFLFICFYYLPRYAKGYKITRFCGEIFISRGVFIKKESILKNENLIYFRTVKTPLSSALGCSFVILSAPRVRIVFIVDNNDAPKVLGEEYEN